MIGMPAHPVSGDAVCAAKFVELPPERFVLDRLLAGGAPAARDPRVQPLAQTIDHILAVGVQRDRAGAGQRVESANDRGQLHLIVGRGRMTPRPFRLCASCAAAKHERPSTGTGIAGARAVGIEIEPVAAMLLRHGGKCTRLRAVTRQPERIGAEGARKA